MSQPATAAIVVGCIVGGVALVFFGYRGYVKWHQHRHNGGPMILPPSRIGQDYASQYLTPSTNTMAGGLYGGEGGYKDSWRGSHSHSKGSITSHGAYGSEASYPYQPHRTSSSQGLLGQSPSAVSPKGEYMPTHPHSPPTPAGDSTHGSPSLSAPQEAYEPVQHPRMPSSRSTTTMIKRTYATSVKSAGGAASTHTSTFRRETYLPHLPENRDQIQIVPPQPLGFGLGGMATALDQKTLAFSSTSGIGSGEDDFSRGLVWQEGNPDATAQAQAARASRLGEEERLRYLAQGPRVLSPSIRGAVHNHIYAGSNAGSSGMRTPDIPSSRSRSPAPVTPWDGSSTSDVGPSVSQRGAISPSQPLSHPLEDNRTTPPPTSHSARNNTAFTNMQSPLALMSGNVSPSPQKEPIRDSPILGAFRNPAQPSQHQREDSGPASGSHSHSNSQNSGSAASGYLNGERTPGLVSESVSTGHGSASAPTTDISEMQAQHDAFAIDEEKRISPSKDGQVQVVGVDDEFATASPPMIKPTENRQSKGWRLGKLMKASKT
jgi:hypothetical protein